MSASESTHSPATGLVAGLMTMAAPKGEIAHAEGPAANCRDRLEPEESALVRTASPAVRAAFSAGRCFAHEALSLIGAEHAPLLRTGPGAAGADRAPAWPAGFVGSLSHTSRHCAAIAARVSTHRAIGIDLEAPSRVTPKLLDRICTAQERAALDPMVDPARAALHFAAREAFYKVWSPVARRSIGFRDVEVIAKGAGRFEVRVLEGVDVAPFESRTFPGYWDADGDLIAAVVLVQARD